MPLIYGPERFTTDTSVLLSDWSPMWKVYDTGSGANLAVSASGATANAVSVIGNSDAVYYYNYQCPTNEMVVVADVMALAAGTSQQITVACRLNPGVSTGGYVGTLQAADSLRLFGFATATNWTSPLGSITGIAAVGQPWRLILWAVGNTINLKGIRLDTGQEYFITNTHSGYTGKYAGLHVWHATGGAASSGIIDNWTLFDGVKSSAKLKSSRVGSLKVHYPFK